MNRFTRSISKGWCYSHTIVSKNTQASPPKPKFRAQNLAQKAVSHGFQHKKSLKTWKTIYESVYKVNQDRLVLFPHNSVKNTKASPLKP